MKNISTEVDYFSSSKSDVCRDGNSLITLVTGVGEEINNAGKPVLNIGLMATSQSTIDRINKSVVDELSLLKGSAADATSNGLHQCYPNGVVLPHQLQHHTNTWPWRLHTHQKQKQHPSDGISRNIDHNNEVSLDVNQQNGHHSIGCNDGGLTKPRKMVRSASMDNLDSPDKYKHKPYNGSSELCEVLGVQEPSESKVSDDLSGLYRRASEPLNMSQPRPLNAVLESIPLAYNPQTKQLHLLKPQPTPHVDCNGEDLCPGACKHSAPTTAVTKCNGNNKCDSSFSADNAHHHALLQRVSTCGSLQSKADCSSFSSISSLCTDLSTASALEDNNYDAALLGRGCSGLDGDEANFIEINLNPHHHHHQRNRSSDGLLNHDGETSRDEQCSPGQGAKSKRRGISDFLTRNILAWRSSRESNVGADEAPGWKLFSKTAAAAPTNRPPTQRDPNRIIEEYHERQSQLNGGDCPSDCSTPRSKRSDDLVASSTTALILENRPSNLPSKAPEEEVKHRLEYQQMVEAAKKKEIKEAKLKKKLAQQQLRHEEQLSQAAKCWNVEILPNWETAKFCRKAKKMWWQGIPPSVRGKVWKLAIGNDLHITHELYEICVCRAKDRIRMAAESISVSEDDFEENLQDKESSVELIKLDVSRTFPQLCIFQKRGPYYDMLHSLLGAYVCYRPDVGYVQGMSFLAAVLILNLEVADAFICFANLMNKPCQLAFFRLDEQMMKSYFLTYEEYFSENLPKLFNHFSKQNLTPDLYLIDWIYTLYSRSLHLDVACRVWDVYFRDGDEFLFRTALGILRLYDDILLNMEFIHLAQFLTKLPEDIGADQLFKSIESIRMVIDKRSFAQVLQSYSEPKQT